MCSGCRASVRWSVICGSVLSKKRKGSSAATRSSTSMRGIWRCRLVRSWRGGGIGLRIDLANKTFFLDEWRFIGFGLAQASIFPLVRAMHVGVFVAFVERADDIYFLYSKDLSFDAQLLWQRSSYEVATSELINVVLPVSLR